MRLAGVELPKVMADAVRACRPHFVAAGVFSALINLLYLAPALFGGDDAPGLFSGAGAATMSDVWRGRFTRFAHLGDDIRVDLQPARST